MKRLTPDVLLQIAELKAVGPYGSIAARKEYINVKRGEFNHDMELETAEQ